MSRQQTREARRQLVLETIKRAFDRFVPGRVNLMNVDVSKKRLYYKENTPIGNLPFEIPFKLTAKEVIIKGQAMTIGDRSMLGLAA